MWDLVLLAVSVAVFVTLLGLAQRWQKKERRPLSLVVARGFRRLGRWFWAVGEGVEIGYHHSQKVKRETNLDLEPRP